MSHDRPPEGPDAPQPTEPGAGSPPPTYGSQPPPRAEDSYPPGPPGGSYGAPPGAGHGAPPGVGGFSVEDAFSYGWRKFKANPGPILLVALAYLAVIAVVQLLSWLVTGLPDSNTGLFASLFVSAIFGLVYVVLSAVMQAGIARGVLDITRGRRPKVETMFTFDDVVTVIIAGLLVGLATAVGIVLCVLPGLVVAFFSQFYVWFIVDRRMGAVDAIKASFRLVGQHPGPLVVFFLASLLAYFVGAILCGVGLLVAIPVIYIAQGYTYRTLQGETVAP